MDRRWLGLVFSLLATTCSDIPVNHDTEEKCGCVAEAVSLTALDAAVVATTTIAPCRSFTFGIEAIGTQPATSCTQSLVCPGTPTGVTVADAVANPDVQAALRAGPQLYGVKGGFNGIGTSRIQIGQAQFDVGAPCETTADCTPIPPGVQALVKMIQAANDQELKRWPCRGTFTK